MDLRNFVRTLRRRWYLVLAMIVVGLGAAIGITEATVPTYQSSVQTFVSLQDADSSTSAYQGDLFSQARVKSYAKLVNTPSVTEPVVHQLHLKLTPQQLANRISASVPVDTVLVDITAKDRSPATARDIANAVGARFAAVIRELEAQAGKPSPVGVTVVRPAALASSPVSPRIPLNIGLGLLVGLGLGVGVAVLRDSMDTSVKTREDLQALTGSNALGIISYDRRARTEPLITQADSRSPRSEAFRGLRTNLRFVDVDRPPKVVVVTSSLSGEGKSTTACNLGLTMASAGIRTVVVEADLRSPSVADYMGLEGAIGLTDVLSGTAPLDDVLQQWGDLPLEVLASGALPPNPSELLSSAQMVQVLSRLRSRADFVLVDTPPLIPVTDAAVLARECDGAILVVRYGRTDRDLVRRAMESLANVSSRLLGTVLTMAPIKGAQNYYYADASGHPRAAAPTAAPIPATLRSAADTGSAPGAAAPAAPAPAAPTNPANPGVANGSAANGQLAEPKS